MPRKTPSGSDSSSSHRTWKLAFEAGVAAFKSGSFGQAVRLFDEALDLGGRRMIVLDSRAATLQKLGRIPEALEDARAMVELEPQSLKGYVRGSLLCTLGTPPQHERACALLRQGVQLAPPDLRTTLERRLDALERQTQATMDLTVRRRANWTDRLPAELIVLVGEHAVRQNPDAGLRLAAVCARWRAVALASPVVWSRLRLHRGKVVTKLAHFVGQSRSRLKDVEVVLSSFDVLSALAPHLSTVDAFQAIIAPELSYTLALDFLWRTLPTTLRHLRLANVNGDLGNEVSDTSLEELFAAVDPPPAGFLLETLSLHHWPVTLFKGPPPALPAFPCLKELKLVMRTLGLGNVVTLLRHAPNLERLSLDRQGRWPPLWPTPDPHLPLHRLRDLKLNGSDFGPLAWDAPALERVDLSRPRGGPTEKRFYRTILFSTLAPDLLLPLVSLNLSHTQVDEELVVGDLRRLPNLVDLQLGYCGVSDVLVEALTLDQPGRVAGPSSAAADAAGNRCPKLQVLGLQSSDKITGGALVRLVASRLSSAAAPDDDDAADPAPGRHARRPLRALNVDSCVLDERKALEWLGAHLQSFSCKAPVPAAQGFADRMRARQ